MTTLTVTANNGNIYLTANGSLGQGLDGRQTVCIGAVYSVGKNKYTFCSEANWDSETDAAQDGIAPNGWYASRTEAADAALAHYTKQVAELETAFEAGYPAAAADDNTVIIKTKCTRKNSKGVESFTQYELLAEGGHTVKGGQTISFPKGTTIGAIKRLYPEYANAKVVVMPNETLKALHKAKCETIKDVVIRHYGVHADEPAGVTVPQATAEEQAADFPDTPDQIQLIKPKVEAPAAEPEAPKPTLNTVLQIIDKIDEGFAALDSIKLEETKAELATIKDWESFTIFMNKMSAKHRLIRRKDGGRVVSFEKYNDKVVTLELDNDKTAYPYYHVLARYFDVVPA